MLSLWSDGAHVSERHQKVAVFHRQQPYHYKTLYFCLVAPAPWWCLSLLKPFAQSSLEDVFNRRSIADATCAMTTLACREMS